MNYFTLINLIQVHACTLSLKLSQLCTQKGTFSNIVRGIGGGGGGGNKLGKNLQPDP